MSDLVNLKCECCGATLNNDLTCPFCGARYERKYNTLNQPIFVKIQDAKIDTLRYELSIDKYQYETMGEEASAEITMHRMTQALATQMAKYMELNTYFDRHTFSQIVRGEVRVVKPDFRFYE